MAQLGSDLNNLDDAFDRDRLAQLRAAVRNLRDDLATRGEAYKILMPSSKKPANRLSSWGSWLAQYGRFREALDGPQSRWPELEGLRERFLIHCPDFRTFKAPGAGWAKGERQYKDMAAGKVREIATSAATLTEVGAGVFDILKKAAKDGPIVRWQTEDAIAKRSPELLKRFHTVLGTLVRDTRPMPLPLVTALDDLQAIMDAGGEALRFGERVNIAYSALAMIRPAESCPIKIERFNDVSRQLTGKSLFVESDTAAVGYSAFKLLFERIHTVMESDWAWGPRDLVDIQGFLWIASTPEAIDPEDAQEAETDGISSNRAAGLPKDIYMPTNLILYGPPGTGKTYATAREAVSLCGEVPPDDRDALMKAYRRLLDAGRIEFVTFHQSMAYEDFVEGLRPTQAEGSAVGFSLEPVPGVLRRIARRAETSTGSGASDFAIGKRGVFKMSIGEASNPDDAYLFEEAIEQGRVILGFEDIDWSDPKYANRDEILSACKAVHAGDNNLNASSGVVQMPHIFRNWMHKGDLIVISKGNKTFRAIGVITGDYRFAPREGGGYAHQRDVEWLWVDRQGVPVEEIYARGFSMRSAYEMTKADLNIPALERYANSQRQSVGGAPEQFVLVIDEINRANISKVFGELITLLEPDKRLGQINEIKVRLPYSPDPFGVPSNLHIVGTMNTADRSIALLDTALRRRFDFREMMPDASILPEVPDIDLSALLTRLNERIEYLFDREHQIGHAFFMNCRTRADVDGVMRRKVLPLLAEYFHEDWGKIAAVLGDAKGERFLERAVLVAPEGLESEYGGERYRWNVRADFAVDAYAGLA